jgi:CubicO group peptidase (beta-lactamase class C family)
MHDQNTDRTRTSLHDQLVDIASNQFGLRAPALSYAVATTTGLYATGAVGTSDLGQRHAATVDDQYPWFSMTKIATATATVRLAERGELKLDAEVGTYLRNYRGNKHGHPTVRQLLTHTAGLGNPLPIRWVRPDGQPVDRALLERIVNKHGRPKRTPGTRAAYSNIGYLLAGQVLEAVTGQPAETVITDLVLRPLGMHDTEFTADRTRPRATGYVGGPRPLHPVFRAVLPAGIAGPRVQGFMSLRPFLVEGAAYGGLVGPAADAVKLAATHLPSSRRDAANHPLGDLNQMRVIDHLGKPFDHGIGWFRKPADADRIPAFVEHYGTGGGFWNAMRIYPELGIAMVGMTNATNTWPFDDFFTAVINAVRASSHNQTT